MTKRIGIFGGTFDPIHNAHIRMAEAFALALNLDQVYVIPAGQPYHRHHTPIATPEQRLAMVRLATADHPLFYVDDREVKRSKPAYTIDTLMEIRQPLSCNDELWLLMGSDSFSTLSTWHKWEKILTLTNLALAVRPGFRPDQLPDALAPLWQARTALPLSTPSAYGKIVTLDLPPTMISATEIRQKLASSAPTLAPINPRVLDYIRRHHLYQINTQTS